MSDSLPDQDEVGVGVDDFDGDDEAAAMAAAMGFASFGMKESDRLSKKRRFNDGAAAAAADPAAGTGANSLPLHPRASEAKKAKQNPDEVDLDNDDDDEGQEGIETNQNVAAPQHVLHGHPLPTFARPPPGPPGTTSYDLPLKPPPGLDLPSFQPAGRGGRGGHGQHSRGGRGGGNAVNRQWYLNYYDPSFNENPWERLEQAKKIPSVGSWLPSRSSGGNPSAAATSS